jgi:hypothetical protein
MLLNMGFNLILNLGLLAGWDVRGVMIAYGFGFFLWVLALTQSVNKPTLVTLLLLDLAVVFHGLLPEIQVTGTGPQFWNTVSTHIVDVWMASIFGLSGITIFKSSLLAWIRGHRADVLTNPKKRFLIPIFVWSGMIAVPPWFTPYLTSSFVNHRFTIAAELLVWGWVALELPFYLVYKRLLRK